MLVGTWVHGLFVVGQAPWGVSTISNLPTMRGKQAAVFCTFALNPGNSLDKLTGAVRPPAPTSSAGWPSAARSWRSTARRSPAASSRATVA